MPIQRSAGAEIRPLIDALGGADDTRREAAIARLAVIGPRAVEHLVTEFPAATGRARAGMLRALEALADPRGLPTASRALADASPAVQTAAIGALRALLGAGRASAERDAFDTLVAVALDRGRAAAVRLAAWDAIRESAQDAREPVQKALAGDPDPDVRAAAGGTPPAADASDGDSWRAAVDGRLPASPDTLKAALAAHRTTARLTELQRMVDQVRAREQQEPDVRVREEWRAVRGAIHQALAARNSRLALYDLRDSLLAADRLPVAFLAAIEEIGDASCLDTLAAAYDESSRSGDTWWREHVASAFRAIVHREGLTRRHAAVKRALTRWPDATADLLGR
jgi:hypothetical protein